MNTPRTYDAIVLGAGAAGLMFAATARGKRVLVLEHNNAPGKKILVSGGGRANFTNIHAKAENFISQNPHFAKSALAQFTARDFIGFIERGQIPWHEKKLGQLFCNNSARDLLNHLLRESERAGAELILNARGLRVITTPAGFTITSSAGQFQTAALVVATGGLSIPKLGASDFGYELARNFGLRVVDPRPALVPLLLAGDESYWTKLAGLSAEVIARVGKKQFTEKMLFTHRGISGPAILQASSYLLPGEAIELNLLAAHKSRLFERLLQGGAPRDVRALRAILYTVLPQRLADAFLARHRGFSNSDLSAFEENLRRWMLHPVGNEGFEKAEVTAGGVDTSDLDARTLMARNVPGLYFIGEVVDVTGQLGGFNFQWAWSSAVAAARSL